MRKILSILFLSLLALSLKAELSVSDIERMAENGNPMVQVLLGDYYALGDSVEQNYEQAVYWYTKAAEQGNVDAQYALGECYALGNEQIFMGSNII